MTTGSTKEPYANAIKALHAERGLVKFPVNVHSLLVERSQISGYTSVIAKQNDISLRFLLDDDDCRYLAELLTKR